jgi:hypothetical protein
MPEEVGVSGENSKDSGPSVQLKLQLKLQLQQVGDYARASGAAVR